MTPDSFNAYCSTLTATTHVVQWGGSDVWKVGGKVFAIGMWGGPNGGITFKVSEMSYDILGEMPGLRPAPYLASRGIKWIQCFGEPGLTDVDLMAYLAESHRLVAAGLSKKKRLELGIPVN